MRRKTINKKTNEINLQTIVYTWILNYLRHRDIDINHPQSNFLREEKLRLTRQWKI